RHGNPRVAMRVASDDNIPDVPFRRRAPATTAILARSRSPGASRMIPNPSPDRYDELIARETRHWDATADHDPGNPQLWDDPRLFELALARPYRHLIARTRVSGGPVLELGCGDGQLACDLARAGLAVTGIDLSEERVARARVRARSLGLEQAARFVSGDLNMVPMPRGAYATVVAH